MAKKINAEQAHEHVSSQESLLVCAYENEEKFRQVPLEGAISLSSFRDREDSLQKDREIIFYCA